MSFFRSIFKLKLKEKKKCWISFYISEILCNFAPQSEVMDEFDIEKDEAVKILKKYLREKSDGVKEYRSHIWRILDKLCTYENYREKIFVILKEYGHYTNDCSKPIIYFDSSYIVSIMDTAFPPEQLSNVLLAERLSNIISSDEFSFHSLDRWSIVK